MPKNTPFQIPTCPEEMAAYACRNAGIDYDSPKGQALLAQIRQSWNAAQTDPLYRPQPVSHPTVEESQPKPSGTLRPISPCNRIADDVAEHAAESEDPSGLDYSADGAPSVASETWQKAPSARGPSPGGRPRIVAPWFETLAKQMADGKSLKKAAAILGIALSKEERGRMYERREFRKMYQAERKKYLQQKYDAAIRKQRSWSS